MTEPTNGGGQPGTPDPNNPNPTNQPGNGGGTDPNKTETQSQPVDFSKLGDDDFAKVFDDPRVFKHPRFKSLNDRAKVADQLEKEKTEAEKKRLADEGKWKELAEKAQQEATEARTKAQTAMVDNKIQVEAAKLGAVDLEAVQKLIDRSSVKVNDDGTISGVEEAVKSLLESKPFLKGKSGSVTIGSPTNPGPDTSGMKKFKLSQLQDPTFYRANAKDIELAYKHNLIEDDMAR